MTQIDAQNVGNESCAVRVTQNATLVAQGRRR